jgi:hypothetical protein
MITETTQSISLISEGVRGEPRLLYGQDATNGTLGFPGIYEEVYVAYLLSKFPQHLCVQVLRGERHVSDEMLRRIEETIDLTSEDAQRILQIQDTPKWKKWIRDQRPKRKRKPRPCRICHEMVHDDFTLSAYPGTNPVLCAECRHESDILSEAEHCGWITADGKLTPEFLRARKRHYKKEVVK